MAERPTLREILDGLPREALADLLLRRAEADPDLAGWIEVELAVTPGRSAVDPAPTAAQARTLLARKARTYWDDYESTGPSDELHELVEKAVPFLEAGDGRNALRVLVAVAEPFIEQWARRDGRDRRGHVPAVRGSRADDRRGGADGRPLGGRARRPVRDGRGLAG
ncbi:MULTISPECIES: hypothetical protein [Methylobacterium]|uniref:hypothetical protein n=1 Tax=Methylobacterium TaxID=407 RepID=UPI0013EB4CA5|nr:hypothetical protein [Methylobacterium sp. DB0501]NGM32627.1 hypothetical protein [Methylobacterium sp. DB0501]